MLPSSFARRCDLEFKQNIGRGGGAASAYSLLRRLSGEFQKPYLKFACAVVSLPITSVQVGVELTQPLVQLTKFRPGAGVAVSVIVVPWANFAEQLLPQLIARSMPEGVPVTVPEPLRPIDSV